MTIENTGWVVGWFAFSLIVAGIAQGKNRSGCIWWLAALIFGPIALFVLLLFPNNPPEKSETIDQ